MFFVEIVTFLVNDVAIHVVCCMCMSFHKQCCQIDKKGWYVLQHNNFVSNETKYWQRKIIRSIKKIHDILWEGEIYFSLLNKVYCNIYSLLFLFLAFYYQRWWLQQKCKANNISLTDNSIFTRETKYKSILSILVNQ